MLLLILLGEELVVELGAKSLILLSLGGVVLRRLLISLTVRGGRSQGGLGVLASFLVLLLVSVGALALIGDRLLGAVLTVCCLVRQTCLRSRMHHHAQWVDLRFVDGMLTWLGARSGVWLPHRVVLRLV